MPGGFECRTSALPCACALLAAPAAAATVTAAATRSRREGSSVSGDVDEETGFTVEIREYLGAISYKAGRKPKLVEFWRMQAVSNMGRKPARDIKAVQWLPLDAAIARLELPLEQLFLRNVGPRALAP